jgi:RNase adapter protein RapZ
VGDIVVVTGQAGAGRSTAADVFEDLGWLVIDGLPLMFMPEVASMAAQPGSPYERVVLVVGASPDVPRLVPALDGLADHGARVRVLFLEASTETLVRRYREARRRHPFSPEGRGSLTEAIEAEREALEEVKAIADLVIDTNDLNVHQLKDRVRAAFGPGEATSTMSTTVLSFGYKYGLPLDVDVVLDCRFLPNPHWVPELRPQTGLDPPVRDYVLDQPAAREFLERVRPLLATLVPAYVGEGKAYLTLAFGCTGGRHRSVAIAEAVAEMLAELHVVPQVAHRDIDR